MRTWPSPYWKDRSVQRAIFESVVSFLLLSWSLEDGMQKTASDVDLRVWGVIMSLIYLNRLSALQRASNKA